MACKRTATSDLNADNWNEEDEPEEAGRFTAAPQEVLEKRVLKTAKRRLPASGEGATKSAFSGFSGFKTLSTPTSSAFSFLAKTNSTTSPSIAQNTNTLPTISPASNGSLKNIENGLSSENNNDQTPSKISTESDRINMEQVPKKEDGTIFKKSSDYFSKLRGLNESVTQWIKTHVESNPFCILTPIFRDYERYLKDIEVKHGKSSDVSVATEKNDNAANSQKNLLETNSNTSSIAEDKSILGNASPTMNSIFGNSNNIFSNKTKTEGNPFLTKAKSTESSAKAVDDASKLESKSLTFPQTNASTFSFGQTTNTSITSAGFSFGGAKPFTFGANAIVPPNSEKKDENGGKEGEDDEPPKIEFKPVTEDGSFYEKRCKVYIKKDGVFGDHGIGVLFLKPTPNGKTQLIVRAENSLGNLLLNTLLTASIPTKRMNEKAVMLVCLPLPDSQPPPTAVLLRVRTSEDADSLLNALDSNKK